VHKLDEAGFPLTHVSIVSQNLQSEKEVIGYITVEGVSQRGLITGTWAGGLLSMLAGAAFLWIPGFGPLIVVRHFGPPCLIGVHVALRPFMRPLLGALSWKSSCLSSLIVSTVCGSRLELY
jgi:hypothetical protein